MNKNLMNMQLHWHKCKEHREPHTWTSYLINKWNQRTLLKRGNESRNISISLQTKLHCHMFEKSVSYFIIISQCWMPNYCVNSERIFCNLTKVGRKTFVYHVKRGSEIQPKFCLHWPESLKITEIIACSESIHKEIKSHPELSVAHTPSILIFKIVSNYSMALPAVRPTS